MKRNFQTITFIIVVSFFIYSCEKSSDDESPYQYEFVKSNSFHAQGWREQQVNISGSTTIFSDSSNHVAIVCDPFNSKDPHLANGCITMNLPTSADPTLRRIRLRRLGYSGTLLSDLTELKYSTHVVQNAPANMVLQIDINGDEAKDFNIFFDPRLEFQNPGAQPFILNQWQQWNTLSGRWYTEIATITGLPEYATIAQLAAQYPNARIIDTPPVGNNGEGVRFTIGGNPRPLFDNTIGYFDALIIGTKKQPQSIMFDFSCN